MFFTGHHVGFTKSLGEREFCVTERFMAEVDEKVSLKKCVNGRGIF